MDDDYFASSSQPHATTPAGPPTNSGWPAPAQQAPAAWQPPVPAGTSITPDQQQLLATSAATSYQNMHTAPASYPVGGKLGFMGNVRVGFQLLPVCWNVLMAQPSLLVVPLILLIAGGLAVFGYADAFGGLANLFSGNRFEVAIKVFPLAAFVTAMGSVGEGVIVAAATDTLNGHTTSLGAAWMKVTNQLPRIVFFGVVYAGERTVTSLLRGKRWSPGTLAANAIDRAWDFATFLTIPVLLYEDLPVFSAVKRSGQLVMKRWGVQLTATSVLGAALFVCTLPLVIIGIVVVASVSTVVGIGIVIVSLLGMIMLQGALNGVLSAALYRFGTTGNVAPGFSEAEMWAVFSRR